MFLFFFEDDPRFENLGSDPVCSRILGQVKNFYALDLTSPLECARLVQATYDCREIFMYQQYDEMMEQDGLCSCIKKGFECRTDDGSFTEEGKTRQVFIFLIYTKVPPRTDVLSNILSRA